MKDYETNKTDNKVNTIQKEVHLRDAHPNPKNKENSLRRANRESGNSGKVAG